MRDVSWWKIGLGALGGCAGALLLFSPIFFWWYLDPEGVQATADYVKAWAIYLGDLLGQ